MKKHIDLLTSTIGLELAIMDGVEIEDFQRALDESERTILERPSESKSWITKGLFLGSKKRPLECIACHDMACRLEPNSETNWIRRGRLFAVLGFINDALACLDHAIRLNERAGEAWVSKGETHIGRLSPFRAKIDPEAALNCFTRALEIDSQNYLARIGKADAMYLMGKYRESTALYKSGETLRAVGNALQSDGFPLERTNPRFSSLIPYAKSMAFASRLRRILGPMAGIVLSRLRVPLTSKKAYGPIRDTIGAAATFLQTVRDDGYNPASLSLVANWVFMCCSLYDARREDDVVIGDSVDAYGILIKEPLRLCLTILKSLGNRELEACMNAYSNYWKIELRVPGLAEAIYKAKEEDILSSERSVFADERLLAEVVRDPCSWAGDPRKDESMLMKRVALL